MADRLGEEFAGIAGFLSSLSNDERERFLSDCEARESPYQIWLYACAMGYEADFRQLEEWLQTRYPQLNRKAMLTAEAVMLESDLQGARGVPDELLKPGEKARNIAALSKELRGHLAEVERMNRSMDRRGLILSGADRLIRVLQDTFSEDDEASEALTRGFEVVWSQLNDER